MRSYSRIRSVFRAWVCIAASLAAPVAFGAAAGRQQAQAQLLDHAELLCANCFFGPSDYYYCFAADSKILVGYQKTPVLNWQDKSKNYLTTVRPAWAAWAAPGQTVPISYDDKHIWVTRANDKARRGFWTHLKALAFWASRGDSRQVKLTQSSVRDIFTNNDRCRGADRTKGD
ncbi:MAG TPA: hypothetical protein VKG86_09415 [Terracidiphilus sp.]|nr:hypothetical protein [Terracidiphilus sp.]